MSNTKENILAYSRILSNKKDNVTSRDNLTDGTNAIINDSVEGNLDAVPTSEETDQQKVSVYNPTSSESHKQMIEDVEQKAIAKAEENKDNPPSSDNAPRTYGEMLKRFYREKIKGEGLTPEQREQREMRLAKIQDGISAIANLIATTQGAQSSFTGENTRTENTRKKWEEFYKKRKEEQRQIYEDQMRALKLKEDLKYRKEKDEEEKRRYEEGIEWRNQQAQKSEERYKKEQEDKKTRQEVEDRRWQETFNEGKRRHDENIKVQNARIDATKAKGVRGKSIDFVDGNGNQVAIYENVWKGSMQGIYDTLVADGIKPDEIQEVRGMSAKDKEDFVKQNWYKSDKAKTQMLTLSTIDPATMTSKISDDGELGWGKSSNNTNSNETDW